MHLDLTERQSVAAPKGDTETERTRVRVDDLLTTIVGAKTGDVCRVPIELADHYVCQSVAMLRLVVPYCAKFTEIFLASPENGQAQWKRCIYGQGRPHLSFEQLRMTAIPLPPLARTTPHRRRGRASPFGGRGTGNRSDRHSPARQPFPPIYPPTRIHETAT